ncbi:MAG: hypothetical protein LBU87_04945 [Lactobacillales bacterium]|jgi:hypothetical protein|nr:hypothetical protein [Lactobacillales bacterium]
MIDKNLVTRFLSTLTDAQNAPTGKQKTPLKTNRTAHVSPLSFSDKIIPFPGFYAKGNKSDAATASMDLPADTITDEKQKFITSFPFLEKLFSNNPPSDRPININNGHGINFVMVTSGSTAFLIISALLVVFFKDFFFS